MKTLNTNAKNLANEKSIVIASKSQDLHGTSPQLRSSDSAREREWAQLRKQNLQCNIESIDCHDSTLRAESRNDIENSFNDANHSVIASERSERGNLQCNTETIDCHALDSAKMQNLIARNDGSAKSRKEIFVIASERSERGNLQCNIDKVDCHANASANSRNDGIISPSLAEGARGWVSFDSTADIVGKDSASVIASKSQDLRGNLQCNIDKVDCHDSTLRAESWQ